MRKITFHLTLILLLTLKAHSAEFSMGFNKISNSICIGTYAKASIFKSIPWHEEFLIQLGTPEARNSLSIIVLDEFLQKKLGWLNTRYDQVSAFLGRAGTDSKLQFNLNLFDAQYVSTTAQTSSVETILSEISANNSLSNQSSKNKRSWLSRFKPSKPKSIDIASKIKDELDTLLSCKLGIKNCFSKLEQSISETQDVIRFTEILIADIRRSIEEVQDLQEYLTEHPDYSLFNTILANALNSLESKKANLKKVVDLEKQKIVIAIVNIRQQYPDLNERLEILFAKYSHLEPVRSALERANNKASTPVDSAHATIKKSTTPILGSDIIRDLSQLFKEEKFKYLQTLADNNDKLLDVSESLEILIQLDLSLTVDVDNLKKIVGFNFNPRNDGLIPSAPIILYYLLKLTKPSKNLSDNRIFLAKLSYAQGNLISFADQVWQKTNNDKAAVNIVMRYYNEKWEEFYNKFLE